MTIWQQYAYAMVLVPDMRDNSLQLLSAEIIGALRSSAEEHVSFSPHIRTNSGDVYHIDALQHQCIALQPGFSDRRGYRTRLLVEVMPEYQLVKLGIYVVNSSRKHLPLNTRRMFNSPVDVFASPCWR